MEILKVVHVDKWPFYAKIHQVFWGIWTYHCTIMTWLLSDCEASKEMTRLRKQDVPVSLPRSKLSVSQLAVNEAIQHVD